MGRPRLAAEQIEKKTERKTKKIITISNNKTTF
jgi:hypothetical protein